MVTKDLGMVTAYAYAVAGGYTGTEAQFEQLMADLAIVVDDFDNFSVIVTTLPEGSSATASYSDGVLSLGIPKGDKGDKGNTGDTGATPNLSVGTVETTTEPTVTITGTAENPILNFGLVKGDKGDTGDVSMQELEDATVVQTLSDSIPYNYRRTNGGNGSGHREYDEIIGASVTWNQLCNKANYVTGTYSGVVITRNGNELNADGTASANAYIKLFSNTFPTVSGHKYLVSIPNNANTFYYDDSSTRQYNSKTAPFMFSGNGASISPYCRISLGVTVTNASVYMQLFDLTAMFGTGIADYIYSLEQANAGAGVSYFRSLFPKPYYEYNAGELLSVSGLQSHDMVGFNVWDEEWEAYGSSQIKSKNLIPLIPNATYYLKAPAGIGATLYFKEDTDIPSSSSWSGANGTFTVPSNIHYAILYAGSGYGTTYKNDICINLSDTSIDGQYFPHEKHTYPLDSSVTLRGQYKLDANNNLYADGDVWKSDGEITRKYGTRAYQSGDESDATVVTDGTTTVYPLTTPTTETAPTYENPQWCDSNGTEEYVGSELPVGHNTDYPMTMVDCADGLANGTYEAKLTIANGVKTFTWQSV